MAKRSPGARAARLQAEVEAFLRIGDQQVVLDTNPVADLEGRSAWVGIGGADGESVNMHAGLGFRQRILRVDALDADARVWVL